MSAWGGLRLLEEMSRRIGFARALAQAGKVYVWEMRFPLNPDCLPQGGQPGQEPAKSAWQRKGLEHSISRERKQMPLKTISP